MDHLSRLGSIPNEGGGGGGGGDDSMPVLAGLTDSEQIIFEQIEEERLHFQR